DVVPAANEAARRTGVEIAASAEAAAAAAGVVVTMLQTGRQVLDIFSGKGGSGGMLAAAAPGTLFLGCSTIAVGDARQAHAAAEAAGHRCL
ncbi:3-hydroxyisobutyrate dehydrogenase, partial [Arthrobacter deserti]|nr:3-hydroxyisobutyrate dehydrogenase [Arthrobacter deserti]